jgi:hypothetical protein
MTGHGSSAPNPEVNSKWPLTSFVRVQLAVAAVWAPHFIGVLILLPVAGLALRAGGVATRLVEGRLVFWAAIGLGALVTVRIMPRVWPAASHVSPIRRLLACVVGPAVAQLLAAGAHDLGVMQTKGSMDPTEVATILVCTLGGACLSSVLLLQQN